MIEPSQQKVAVLFARRDSVYKQLPGCEVYDQDRDALTFTGGMPVIAHPPCRAWSAFAHLAKPKPGEKDLARFAVKMVRENGGVLEHPASSRLWTDQQLPEPGKKDQRGGWTLAAPQWWWGHRANKPTRFYVVGCTAAELPEIPLRLGDSPCVVTTSKRKCETPAGEWRERLGNREKEATPEGMARWLIAVARCCRRPELLPAEPKQKIKEREMVFA